MLGTMIGSASPPSLSTHTLFSADFLAPFCMNKLPHLLSASVKNRYHKSILYVNYILLNTLTVEQCKVNLFASISPSTTQSFAREIHTQYFISPL